MLYICSLRQHFVFFPACCFTAFSRCHMPAPLQTTYHVDLFRSPLHCLSPPHHAQITRFCFAPGCAAETMYEIYWSRVPPFDTQDMANRSCAISRLLRLPCKADLSCLQAIFKLWAPETYGAMGNFIIHALHLSDLIQVCRRSCQSAAYIYMLPRQTRAPVTNPTISTLAGVTPGGASRWTALRSSHKIIGSICRTHHLWKRVRGIKKKGVILFQEAEGLTREWNTKGSDILKDLGW